MQEPKLFKANAGTTELWISSSTPRAVARSFAGCLAVILLLVPVIVLNVVESSTSKFIVIVIAASTFISTLTTISPAGMAEVFVAGATYAAVLVVFVSQDGLDRKS